MDSFELNKIAMAVLATVFILMSITFLAEAIYHIDEPQQAGYVIEAGEGSTVAAEAVDTGPAYDPIEALLASADLGAGESVFKKCAACHTMEQGGANKVGPNLYNIVGGPIAAVEGFGYSAALREYAEGRTWTFEELNGFLFKPRDHVAGTAMGFAGLRKTDERADLIAWMRQFADTPAPLPGS